MRPQLILKRINCGLMFLCPYVMWLYVKERRVPRALFDIAEYVKIKLYLTIQFHIISSHIKSNFFPQAQ